MRPSKTLLLKLPIHWGVIRLSPAASPLPPPPPPFLHFFVSVKTVKDAWLLGLSRRNDRPTTSLSGWPGAAGEQYYFNLTPHFNLLKSRKDILLSISSNKNVKFKRTDRVVFRRHLTFPSVLQWLRLHHLFKCNASVQLGTKDERSFEETGLETTNALRIEPNEYKRWTMHCVCGFQITVLAWKLVISNAIPFAFCLID